MTSKSIQAQEAQYVEGVRIYVLSALVATFKVATNCSTYADQIRAFEDYPDVFG